MLKKGTPIIVRVYDRLHKATIVSHDVENYYRVSVVLGGRRYRLYREVTAANIDKTGYLKDYFND